MKKNFLMLLTATGLLWLGGCTESDNIPVEAQSNAIEFRPVLDKTRASLVDNTSELENFFVKGYQVTNLIQATDSFLSASVYKTGSEWTYSPKKYWPVNNDSVNFYAFAPYSSTVMRSLKSESNTATFSYLVPFNQKASNTAVDLLVADTFGRKEIIAPVQFKFSHALSAVTFSAKNANDNKSELIYTISSIEITNLYTAGKYKYRAGWDSFGFPNNYTAGLPASGVAVQPVGSLGNFVNLLSANDLMMVLPQTPDVSISKVWIFYSLKDGEGAYIYENAEKELSLPAAFKFEMGKMYNFQFTFDASNAITFAVEDLKTWEPIEDVTIP